MASSTLFREDVARILTGLARAASRYDSDVRHATYQQGYIDGLGDVAASLGISVQDVVLMPTLHVERLPAPRQSNGDGEVVTYQDADSEWR